MIIPSFDPNARVYTHSVTIVWHNKVFTHGYWGYWQDQGFDIPNLEPHLSYDDAFRTAEWDKPDGFMTEYSYDPNEDSILKVAVGGRRFHLIENKLLIPGSDQFLAQVHADIWNQ